MCGHSGGDSVALCIRQGQSKICNALLNYVVCCCNVSYIALSASHMYSHRRIWHIRNAFISVIIIIKTPF